VAAEFQVGLDPIRQRPEAKLFQTRSLLPYERLVAEIGERLTAKQGQGAPKQVTTFCRIGLATRGLDQRFEPARVDAPLVDVEQIAGWPRLDRLNSEQLP
jgi:hypothetical protein